MRIIKTLTDRLKKFVATRGGTFPKIFVWVYASVFLGCGVVTITGILYEFFTKGVVNYQAVNNFVREYFAPSIVGSMGVIGVLLIDKDKDGIPDKWQQEEENVKGDSGKQNKV